MLKSATACNVFANHTNDYKPGDTMPRENVMEVNLFFLSLGLYFAIVGKAVHPGCECLVYSTTFGKGKGLFTSPDFPKPYSPNIDCVLYTFTGQRNEIVKIQFHEFDVRRTHLDCLTGDYVKLFLHLDDGNGVNEYTPWESLLCGGLSDIPAVFYSSGPELVLEFHTGVAVSNATGFSGTFEFMDRKIFKTTGQRLSTKTCDFQFTSTDYVSSYGNFYSPRYPSSYPKNVRCSYLFKARYNERVHVVFEEIYLQRGDVSCLNRADIIRIYDGMSSSDPIVGLLCNEATEIEMFATGSNLLVEFVANSNWPGQGFKGRYRFLSTENNFAKYDRSRTSQGLKSTSPNVSETRSSCDLVFNSDNSKNGTFSSPHYPYPYPLRTTCRYEFEGRGKERVQIVFHDFHLYASVHDPKDCNNQDSVMVFVLIEGRLDKVDGFCGSTPPHSVMSNGPRLLVEMKSVQGVHNSRGFRASYSFLGNYAINSGVQIPQYPCAFVYSSNDSKSGDFYSPNYPGPYPRDVECHYFFYGHDDERVHLHFHYFDIEGVGNCDGVSASDYVEFSNFMSIDTKFTRHCGHIDEFDVKSDRKFFRVTFKSNNRLDGQGFNATYRFLDKMEATVHLTSDVLSSFIKLDKVQIFCITLLLIILSN